MGARSTDVAVADWRLSTVLHILASLLAVFLALPLVILTKARTGSKEGYNELDDEEGRSDEESGLGSEKESYSARGDRCVVKLSLFALFTLLLTAVAIPLLSNDDDGFLIKSPGHIMAGLVCAVVSVSTLPSPQLFNSATVWIGIWCVALLACLSGWDALVGSCGETMVVAHNKDGQPIYSRMPDDFCGSHLEYEIVSGFCFGMGTLYSFAGHSAVQIMESLGLLILGLALFFLSRCITIRHGVERERTFTFVRYTCCRWEAGARTCFSWSCCCCKGATYDGMDIGWKCVR